MKKTYINTIRAMEPGDVEAFAVKSSDFDYAQSRIQAIYNSVNSVVCRERKASGRDYIVSIHRSFGVKALYGFVVVTREH